MRTVKEYNEILNSAYNSFNLILEELSQSYLLYKLYPNNNSYKKEFNRDVQNLERIKSKIYMYKNNLIKDSEILTNSISEINDKITKLNRSNNFLTKKLNTLENQNFAAGGELIDKKYIYNINLAENIILLGVIFTSIGIYYFKKRD